MGGNTFVSPQTSSHEQCAVAGRTEWLFLFKLVIWEGQSGSALHRASFHCALQGLELSLLAILGTGVVQAEQSQAQSLICIMDEGQKGTGDSVQDIGVVNHIPCEGEAVVSSSPQIARAWDMDPAPSCSSLPQLTKVLSARLCLHLLDS